MKTSTSHIRIFFLNWKEYQSKLDVYLLCYSYKEILGLYLGLQLCIVFIIINLCNLIIIYPMNLDSKDAHYKVTSLKSFLYCIIL